MISVVIPVYNRPRAAHRAARSALAQVVDDEEIEVVLVDDASEPALDAGGLERTRVIRLGRNSGPAAARNRGIAESRGDIIAFLDSDDVWLPGKLASQMARWRGLACDASLTGVVCGFYYPERATGRVEGRMPAPGRTPLEFASGCWIVPGTVQLMPRSAFERVGPLDESLRRLEDYDWLLRFALAGGRIEVADHMGAVIAPSGLAKTAIVSQSIARLARKFGPGGKHLLIPEVARCFAAYLALERAAADFADGNPLCGALSLAKSVMLKPRLRGQLLPFWIRSGDVPAGVAAIYRELAAGPGAA